MAYRILQRSPNGEAKCIEKAEGPYNAQRAMLILSAHELKNGRVADFVIEPPIGLDGDIERFDLPDWALEELRKAGM